jgi:hypothetical protein
VPSDRADDPFDYPRKVFRITKGVTRVLQAPRALDINPIGTIHHDLRHAVVPKQGFQRPKPEHLVDNLLDEPIAILSNAPDLFLGQEFGGRIGHHAPRFGPDQPGEVLLIEVFDEALMNLLPKPCEGFR